MDKSIEKIHKAGLKFLVPLTPEETYSIIVNEALKLVDAKYGSILLEQNGKLRRVYASSPLLYKIKLNEKGHMFKVFKNRKPLILTNEQIQKIHPDFKLLQTHSDISVPLSYKNKSIGVLTIQSDRGKNFAKKDLNILKLFCHLASLAIRKTQLYDETKKALEVRDLFIALAAHELRTPLTTLNGYIQLLSSRFSNKKSTEASWIKQLSKESARLTHLVKELLEINRMQSGNFSYIFSEHSLREIVKRAITNFSFSFPSRKLILKDMLGKKDVVIGDSEKLIQVFNNILNNAAKFSPPQIPIILQLNSTSLSYVIRVQDRGHGISKEEHNKIFKLFYKAHNNLKEGLGIGLFLAKNIIGQHRGSINIESELNKGTTVEIKLPKSKL